MPSQPIGHPFDPAALAQSLHTTLGAALATIPDDHQHALIFDGSDAQTEGAVIRVLYLQKAPKGWNLVLDGDYSGAHGVAGQVLLSKSW
jgi:hypothetical protein